MSQDIDKFIKFLSDLNRGCHIEDLYDGLVYFLHNGQLRYVKSSTYRSHFFEVLKHSPEFSPVIFIWIFNP